ncbi:hypothetical protein A33M_2397 [Rhodovulum sp. PH10]|nr:hypothetical protein A33M_2397 [Rhodovulum sp. PH10]
MVAGSVVFSSVAIAQPRFPSPIPNSRGTADDQQACERDAKRLCKDYLGDDMAVLSCFQAKRSRLSPGCRGVLEKYGQ